MNLPISYSIFVHIKDSEDWLKMDSTLKFKIVERAMTLPLDEDNVRLVTLPEAPKPAVCVPVPFFKSTGILMSSAARLEKILKKVIGDAVKMSK